MQHAARSRSSTGKYSWNFELAAGSRDGGGVRVAVISYLQRAAGRVTADFSAPGGSRVGARIPRRPYYFGDHAAPGDGAADIGEIAHLTRRHHHREVEHTQHDRAEAAAQRRETESLLWPSACFLVMRCARQPAIGTLFGEFVGEIRVVRAVVGKVRNAGVLEGWSVVQQRGNKGTTGRLCQG